MSQCEALSELGNIRCVMEAGHEPVGTFHGVALQHNFGGTGPYTPPMGYRTIYPVPRAIDEVTNVTRELLEERERPTLNALHDAVLTLLPSYAYVMLDGLVAQWTTPAGEWRLRWQFRSWNEALYTLIGPHGKWAIRDPHIQHIRAVLIITGAIEENPHV